LGVTYASVLCRSNPANWEGSPNPVFLVCKLGGIVQPGVLVCELVAIAPRAGCERLILRTGWGRSTECFGRPFLRDGCTLSKKKVWRMVPTLSITKSH
jgi:hypothetical protein